MADRDINVRISAVDETRAAFDSTVAGLRGLNTSLDSLMANFRGFSEAARAQALSLVGMSAAAVKTTQELMAQARVFDLSASSIRKINAELAEMAKAEEELAAKALAAREALLTIGLGPNVDRQLISASASASVLARSLSAAAEADARLRDEAIATAAALARQKELAQITAVRTMTPQTFGAVVGRRAGISPTTLSAEESARAFQQHLGPVGTGLTLTQASGFGQLVNQLAGVKAEFLSAEESARVFERELGPLGQGVILTASQGFHQLVADLAGVRSSYLSAADSAKVFAEAGMLSEAEQNVVTRGRQFQSVDERRPGQRGVAALETRHGVAMFDELARGQRGQFISSLGSAMRDAGLSSTALLTSFSAFVALMGTAAVIHGAENMARLAQSTQAGAMATGMSVERFSALQGALQIMGQKSDEADRGLRHFAESLNTALADPTSKAAAALSGLGITQDQLAKSGNNVSEMFTLLAGNVNHYKDTATKAAAIEELFGQGSERVALLLSKGAEGIKELEAEAERLGITLDSKAVASLEKTGEKAELMSLAIHGKAIQAFVAWGPAIEGVIGLLTSLGSVIGDVVAGIGRIPGAINDMNAAAERAAGMPRTLGRGLHVAGPLTPEVTPPLTPSLGRGLRVAPQGAGPQDRSAMDLSTPALAPPPDQGLLEVPAIEKSDVVSQIQKEIADARDKAAIAAQKSGSTGQQLAIAEDKAEIAAIDEAIKKYRLKTDEIMKLQAESARLHASMIGTEMKGGGAPTQMQEVENAIAHAKEQAMSISGADPGTLTVRSLEATIEQIKSHLDSMKLTPKVRLELDTKLADAQAELFRAKLTEQMRDTMEKVRNIGATANIDIRARVVMQDFQSLSAGKYGDRTQSIKAEMDAVMQTAQTQIAMLQQVASAANQTDQGRIEAEEKIKEIAVEAGERVLELYKQLGSAAKQSGDIATDALTSMFTGLDQQVDRLGSDFMKAIVAPQQEIIKAGLTTIHVSLQGQMIRREAQKIFESLAGDFVNSVLKGMSQLAAQNLAKLLLPQGQSLAPGAGIGGLFSQLISGGGGMASQMGMQQNAQKLAEALQKAGVSAVVFQGSATQAASASQLNTAATGSNTGALSLNSATTTTNTGVTASDTIGTVTNTGAKTLNTVGTTTNTVSTGTNTLSTIANTLATDADTLATWAEDAAKWVAALFMEGGGVVPGFSFGGLVPSAAGGMITPGGGGGMLSILHPREMVLPRHLSEGVQSAISGGGFGRGNTTSNAANLNYSPTINMGRGRGGSSREELSSLLSSHASSLVGEARNLIRAGWRP